MEILSSMTNEDVIHYLKDNPNFVLSTLEQQLVNRLDEVLQFYADWETKYEEEISNLEQECSDLYNELEELKDQL